MLIESRSMIRANLLTRATMPYSNSLALRNILLTDFNAIQHSDSVAFLQVRHSGKISQRGQGQEQTIRLFTTQLHSLDIALFRIQITTARIAVFILATNQIIYLTELFRQLTINREINAQLAFRVVQRNNYSIAEAISQLQTVCVGVLTNILQTSNISTVSHITFSLFIKIQTLPPYKSGHRSPPKKQGPNADIHRIRRFPRKRHGNHLHCRYQL